MHVPQIEELIEYIETLEDAPFHFVDGHDSLEEGHRVYFYMPDFIMQAHNDEGNYCGTAGCLAGSYVMMKSRFNDKGEMQSDLFSGEYEDSDIIPVDAIAARGLGLNGEQKNELFNPPNIWVEDRILYSHNDIKKKHALYVLKGLLLLDGVASSLDIRELWKNSFEDLGR